MKSRILTCLIFFEIALTITLAVAAARSYGHVLPITTPPSNEYSPTPTPLTGAWKITSTNSTAREGLASWYDRESCIRESGQAIMANNQPLDDNAMTCALWIVGKHGRPLLPDGRLVKITSVQDGCSFYVAWTDNGPGCVPRSEGVICDLTPRAMRVLAGEDGIREGRVEITLEGI